MTALQLLGAVMLLAVVATAFTLGGTSVIGVGAYLLAGGLS